MDIPDFTVLKLPRIIFGSGRFAELPLHIGAFGKSVLVVTGSHSLQASGQLQGLLLKLDQAALHFDQVTVIGEPSPEMIDAAISSHAGKDHAVVVAIGGGSVLDAGKAISAMLLHEGSVERFIEGQENFVQHDGSKVPFIAVPTTSGTGSEVTNNAVISKVGRNGYKRSLRHREFVPDIALVDPELMTTVPPGLTAAAGMDACTKLIEAFVSPYASPYTDALAVSGLERFQRSFMRVCTDAGEDSGARSDLAYAALMSGIALANAGLGIVHGFASSVGGLFDIPHGVLCATLLAEAASENIRQLHMLDDNHPALLKYARAGSLLDGAEKEDVSAGCERLLKKLLNGRRCFIFHVFESMVSCPKILTASSALPGAKAIPFSCMKLP